MFATIASGVVMALLCQCIQKISQHHHLCVNINAQMISVTL